MSKGGKMFGRKKRFQQGDILFESIGRIPKKAKKLGRKDGKLIIAEGEVSGHIHSVESEFAELFDSESLSMDVEKFLKVEKGKSVEVTHQEHDTVILPPGDYAISRVREMHYDLDTFRANRVRPVFD